MLKRVPNVVDLVFLLHYRQLIFLAQHDCQPFPPSMKCNAFGVLTLFVNLGNYSNFFHIFEYAPSQDGVISVETDYQFTSFAPCTTIPTPDLASTA